MVLPPSTISFSHSPADTWQFSTSIPEASIFSAWISSDGLGSVSMGRQPKDTGVSTDHSVELLVADTGGNPFHNPCSTAKYTGNTDTDLACIAQAAVSQGYNYAFSDSWETKPPCKCP